MNRYDIFAVHNGVQLTLQRGALGNPDMLRAAAQTEADEWRRGARVVVVPTSNQHQPTKPEHIEL